MFGSGEGYHCLTGGCDFLILHDSFMGLGCSSVVDQVFACSKSRAQSLVLRGTGR